MAQNLKEFVCKLVQKENKTNFPHLYIVDKQTGPYRRIQDAIEAAEPNSLIKVTEGFYEENLVINKPLTIQPKSIGENSQKIGVVLLIESGIGIHIKLPYSESQVSISGLKISHTGNSSELQMELIQHQHILNIFEDHEKQTDQLEHEYINRIAFNKIQNMVMFVEVGKVNISMCVFSLKYLVKSCRLLIPAICIDKEGELNMVDSQVKGNDDKDTIGILCKLGVINLRNCIISDHKQGGVLAWGVKDNGSKITKNKIERNSVGIHATGEEYKLKIYQNQIVGNRLGVKVGLACEVEISRNYICENGNGMEIYSSFPVVYLNKINKNKENGISVYSYKKMICNAKIKKNVSITGNQKCGILISGQNNKTKIVQNYLVAFNKQSGIRVQKESFPLILKNKIYKNYIEGILITEDANAVIEKNFISNNIECNIALGGVNSFNSLIVQNSIKNSPGMGINVVDGMCNILRNDISHNMEGIYLFQSSPRIRRNYIAYNNNDGIRCEGECNPTLVENLITRNQAIGLFLRQENGYLKETDGALLGGNSGSLSVQGQEGSGPIIFSNIIVSNEINVGLQFKNELISRCLKNSNTIEGEIQEPRAFSCSIM